MKSDTFSFGRLPRLSSWWVIALALSVIVFLLAPHQLPVSLYKLNLIALAAVSGYWIDRSVFPYARPSLDALDVLRCDHDEPLPDEIPSDAVNFECELEIPLLGPVPLYFMAACMLRRAVIMSATIVAVGLGA